MSSVNPVFDDVDAAEQATIKKEKRFATISKTGVYLNVLGLGWFIPILKMVFGDSPKHQMKELWQLLGVPLLGILIFLFAWSTIAPTINTSLGAVPGPSQVWEQVGALWVDHKTERAKGQAFYDRQDARNQKLIDAGKQDKVKWRKYTGKPTYLDQIITSLQTVALGFLIATIIAVPLGIASGLSRTVNGALNPLIQIFKPVSPLAWLPLVTMVVSALYANQNGSMPKAMVISAVTVTLCSLWPTLINTALGVSSIDKDLMNVSKVLRLSTMTTVFKVILPASLPLIFTGLRLSLGVGWMVLIAAEMLAQNPGLGKFVWDEFQNGSSLSLAKILVAVLTIGLIGFLLDRVMYALQTAFTFSASR